ncbi:V-type ATP synthase subunit I domain-containing protein [Vallitalea okinawensis]|uniref:hypothetical protein n=1 Tax=Vallitalea okinawensis TaxID=2078660 RepID=UPI000CFB100D|nr:hypothetical protein [Vallitalea okinawensis]
MNLKKQDKEELFQRLNSEIAASKLNILTIDVNWHELFDEGEKHQEIIKLEEKVNTLLKERGGLTNDHKRLFKTKKQLMDQILVVANKNLNSGEDNDELLKLKERVEDINDEMIQIQDRLIDVPYEIQIANKALFIDSAVVCYNKLEVKSQKVSEIDKEVEELRQLIKEKMVQKEEINSEMEHLYESIHNVAGAIVVEKLDNIFGGKDD